MTICNMSIEGGARAGLIAPDDTTFEYLHGRPHAPQGAAWDAAVARWRTLPPTTARRTTGRSRSTPPPSSRWSPTARTRAWASRSRPRPVARGTGRPRPAAGPGAGARVHGPAARPADPRTEGRRRVRRRCTNGRISDLRLAAAVMKDRRVADGVRMMVVPGSRRGEEQAEREGLGDIFRAAGAEWREAGCSMCIAMNGDQLTPGQYAISTSNRNFEGRQGKGGRGVLASPLTAAASAISGVVDRPADAARDRDGRAHRGPLRWPFHTGRSRARSSRSPRRTWTPTRSFPARYLKVTDKDGRSPRLRPSRATPGTTGRPCPGGPRSCGSRC